MAVLSGTDESGAPALYDIPDAELSKYKLNLKPKWRPASFDSLSRSNSQDSKIQRFKGFQELIKYKMTFLAFCI